MNQNNNTRRNFHRIMLTTAALLSVATVNLTAQAATAQDLNQDAAQALQALCSEHPEAEQLAKDAKAMLIFPKIIKAGLMVCGSYGEGVMTRNGSFVGHYNSVSNSWGWEAGVDSYGYIVFLMDDKAVDYLAKNKGWEFGVGPNAVVVDGGIAQNLSTSTLQHDAYAYIFDQRGMMTSLNIEGTKVSPIKKR